MDNNPRFYRSYITHQFQQPDSIIPQPTDPQSLNRYSYVLNNPIRFSDPTGHCSVAGREMPDNSPACGWSVVRTFPVISQMVDLGIYGDEEAATQYVTASECTQYTCSSDELPQAMMHKYNEYCSGGAWTAKCIQSFWGYFEGILKADGSGFSSYDSTTTNDLAAAILDNQPNDDGTYNPHGSFTNDGQGCQGNSLFCDWANFSIASGRKFIETAHIPDPNGDFCTSDDCNLYGPQSYSIWVHYQAAYNKYFIVMDVDAHDLYCNGEYSKPPYNFCYH